MKFIYQVCTLKQAKELKKLGLIQFSYISYYIPTATCLHEKKGVPCFRYAATYPSYPHGWEHHYSAPTTAELGEILPEWVYSKLSEVSPEWAYSKLGSGEGRRWCCSVVKHHLKTPKKIRIKTFYAPTEAQARAQMLIYLLKNKLISVMKINRILTRLCKTDT